MLRLLWAAWRGWGCYLIELGVVGETRRANCLQDTQDTHSVDIGGVLRHLERNLHVALGRQVVDFCGPHVSDDGGEAARIRQITVVKDETWVKGEEGEEKKEDEIQSESKKEN